MRGVARSLPATWRAEKVLGKAEKSAVASESEGEWLGKLNESARALAVETGEDAAQAAGQALFAAVALCRKLGVDPEQALNDACDDYIKRFTEKEYAVCADGRQPDLKESGGTGAAQGTADRR